MGGPGPQPGNSLDNVVYLFYSLKRGSNGLQRKLYFSKDPKGVYHFPGGKGGGVQLFPGRSKC